MVLLVLHALLHQLLVCVSQAAAIAPRRIFTSILLRRCVLHQFRRVALFRWAQVGRMRAELLLGDEGRRRSILEVFLVTIVRDRGLLERRVLTLILDQHPRGCPLRRPTHIAAARAESLVAILEQVELLQVLHNLLLLVGVLLVFVTVLGAALFLVLLHFRA